MTDTPFSPSETKGDILVVDDEVDIREGLELLLSTEGFKVTLAQNGTEGIEKMEAHIYDLVIKIGRIIALPRQEYENTHLKRALKERYSFPNIIGKSERMVRTLDLVAQVASSRSTILITGETGTGKEIIAKAIHANSPRADQMFVAVNSGSLPPDLLESTLFGHVRGAFTSAIQTKKGYFEVADRGTIFFDEIGTLGPETQIKLLRVIQEKEFTALGATDPQRVDVRILAATNADLAQLVKEGKFREDLYYRLNV